MVTGREIIFQWVARMILMSTYLLGEIPFREVYFTGILFDKDGNKMSKSLGNVIDPLEMIKEYGTDALRLSVISGIAPGVDFRFQNEKIIGQRNFVNKVWNIGRFVMTNLDESLLGVKVEQQEIESYKLNLEDKWILSRLSLVVNNVTDCLDKYKLSLAIEELHDFVWNDLADWYLEMVKKDLFGNDHGRKLIVQKVLVFVLTNILKLMHPFMPFVTEKLWSILSKDEWGKLIIAKWPENLDLKDEEVIKKIEKMKEMIIGTRKMIADFGLVNQKGLKIYLQSNDIDRDFCRDKLKRMVKNVDEVEMVEQIDQNLIHDGFEAGRVGLEISLEMKSEQQKRIKNEMDNLVKYINVLQKKLQNEKYVANAPVEVVEEDRKKLAETQGKLVELESGLKKLISD
jgi:valyl-tRNA synthetase